MNLDRKSGIFGSFSRKKQSQCGNFPKRRSLIPSISVNAFFHKENDRSSTESSPIKCKIEKRSTVSISTNASDVKDILKKPNVSCAICSKCFENPRILPCFHSFCQECLISVVSHGEYGWRNDFEGGSSSGSGNDQIRVITCPICQIRHELPAEGICGLPLNNFLASKPKKSLYNPDIIRILCDQCTFDVTASHNCKTCRKNLCSLCYESHKTQKATVSHDLIPLIDQLKSNSNKCRTHPQYNLQIYCVSCMQALCEKCTEEHQQHKLESIQTIMQNYTKSIKDLLTRAKPATEQAKTSLEQLETVSRKIELRSTIVQKEVEAFIDIYKQSLDEHKQTLLKQVKKSREDKLKALGSQKTTLERHVSEAQNAIQFAEELLAAKENDVEMLRYVGPLLDKLEWCGDIGRQIEPRVSDCIQFLSSELVPATANKTPLYGMITTQTVCPNNCILETEQDLQNLRIHRKVELFLNSRDVDNHPLCHGGETIHAELQYHDSSLRTVPITITDLRNGSYNLAFIPDNAGVLTLLISIKGRHIKGSPFTMIVRTIRPHYGIYHCCSFCSSGGSKQAICGCSGRMPGGYKGCGHGHEGHPGKRHWSCCGSIYEHSECNHLNSTSSHY